MATMQQYATQLMSDEAKHCLIRTRSGEMINPLDPRPSQVHIEDIAFGLASISRYAGQSRLTVAQHCCHVADMLASNPLTSCYAFDGLMHDASEYLLGDLVSPLKRIPEFDFYRAIEAHVFKTIALKYRCTYPEPQEVKVMDIRMCITEQRDIFKREPMPTDAYSPLSMRVSVWPRHKAEWSFLQHFEHLAPKGIR